MGQLLSIKNDPYTYDYQSNDLTTIPRRFLGFHRENMKNLFLDNNKLQDFPNIEKVAPNLECLSLCLNLFRYMPPTFGNLTKLRRLVCYYCNI